MTPEELKVVLGKVLEIAEVLARFSPTTVDDQVVAALKLILASDASIYILALLLERLSRRVASGGSLSGEELAALETAAKAIA